VIPGFGYPSQRGPRLYVTGEHRAVTSGATSAESAGRPATATPATTSSPAGSTWTGSTAGGSSAGGSTAGGSSAAGAPSAGASATYPTTTSNHTEHAMDLPPGVVYPTAVPQQRGTVYGGNAGELNAGDMTMMVPGYNAAENSGSLTGHILAAGWAAETPLQEKNSNKKVMIVLAVILAVLLGVSVVMLFVANDFISGLLKGAAEG
jgi:hypothetical protein